MTAKDEKRVAGDSLATRPGYLDTSTRAGIHPQGCGMNIMPQPQPKIKSGQRFGRLIAVEGPNREKRGGETRLYWVCRCNCGRILSLRSDRLKSGETQSCGCLPKPFKYGDVPARSIRTYRIWSEMRYRCYRPTNKDFKYYGGRGITVCSEWLHDFRAFQDWALSHGYQDDLTLDRIDNDKGYSPDNCRWVTMDEQNKNHRKRS